MDGRVKPGHDKEAGELVESPYTRVKTPLTIWAQADSRFLDARTGMLGHLVSASRQSPPDFGIASWLRAAAGALQSQAQRLIAQAFEAMHHGRKQLPQ